MEKLRKKLEEVIETYGVSSRQAYDISVQLDEEIVKYYQHESFIKIYKKSKYAYEQYKKKGITARQWDKLAKKKHYLSSESMHYLENITFETEKNSIIKE